MEQKHEKKIVESNQGEKEVNVAAGRWINDQRVSCHINGKEITNLLHIEKVSKAWRNLLDEDWKECVIWSFVFM